MFCTVMNIQSILIFVCQTYFCKSFYRNSFEFFILQFSTDLVRLRNITSQCPFLHFGISFSYGFHFVKLTFSSVTQKIIRSNHFCCSFIVCIVFQSNFCNGSCGCRIIHFSEFLYINIDELIRSNFQFSSRFLSYFQ